MKIQEMRVGNYYHWEAEGKDYLFQVEPRDFKDDNYLNFEEIPLTEEWILNFGFIKEVAKVSGGYYYLLDGLAVIVKDGIFYFSIKQLQSRYLRTVDYVHTLQNLCFYLRYIELTLNNTNESL